MMKIEVESFPEDDGSKPIVLKTVDGECVVVEQGEAVIVFCLTKARVIAQAILLVAGDGATGRLEALWRAQACAA